MAKVKYESLNKDEKKKIVKEYQTTDKGKDMMSRLNRLVITGIFGIALSVFIFLDSYGEWTLSNYLIMIPLFLASIFFIMMSCKLRKKVLNKYYLNIK